MKKILHMTPADVNSGVYKYVFNNLEYIDMEKYEFGFLTRASEDLRKTEMYKKYQFQIHSFKSTQRENAKKLDEEVRNILKGYDIIHLHTSSWRGFLIEQIAMDLKMEKVIVHSHSSGIDIFDSREREVQMKEHIMFRRSFSEKYATDFCACSKKAADWLFGKSIPKKKIQYLPNAIDVTKFRYDIKRRKIIRKKLNVNDKVVIGHVGRYSYTKNQAFLISCMKCLKNYYPNIVLICLGQGELKQFYQKLIRDMRLEDNVYLMDWQENVYDYLQAFDVFCLPSKFEGFPISVVEAQTAGLPCIVSDKITEEVRLTPLVYEVPLEEKKWVEKILEVLIKKEDDRAVYADEVEKQGYDIRTSVRLLERLYDR